MNTIYLIEFGVALRGVVQGDDLDVHRIGDVDLVVQDRLTRRDTRTHGTHGHTDTSEIRLGSYEKILAYRISFPLNFNNAKDV